MYDGVRRAPQLAAGGDIVLFLRDEVVELGTRCRVGRHVEDALRVVQDALLHIGNGIAQVLRFIVALEVGILQGLVEQGMGLAGLALDFHVGEVGMLFAVAAELIRTGIGMVMALEDDVDLIGIVNRRELRPQEDAVGIGVVQAAAVDVLMHDDDTPFRIGMGFDGLFDEGLMVGGVVVVGIDDDEQGIAISIIVAVAGLGRIRFFGEGIRYVEMILITAGQAVVVADARCFRQAAQGGGGQVAGILIFLELNLIGALVLGRFVDLVPWRYEEVDFRMLAQGFVQGLVPVISIVAGCDVASLFGTAFSRCLSSRCADLRVADIHEGEVVRVPRLDRLGSLPGPVDFDLIPVGLFGFQAFGRDFVGIILGPADDGTSLIRPLESLGPFHVLVVGNADFGFVRVILGIPAKIELCRIGTRCDRNLFVIGLDGIPVGLPLLPVRIIGYGRPGRDLRRQGRIVPMFRSGKDPKRSHAQDSSDGCGCGFLMIVNLKWTHDFNISLSVRN